MCLWLLSLSACCILEVACLDEGPTGRGTSVERLDSAVEKRAKEGQWRGGGRERDRKRQRETEAETETETGRREDRGGGRGTEREGEGGRGSRGFKEGRLGRREEEAGERESPEPGMREGRESETAERPINGGCFYFLAT